jgi:hypothetical protein
MGVFPETEINLENTADLVEKSRKNGENRGKTEKTLIKTVYFFNRTLRLGYILLQSVHSFYAFTAMNYERG